MNTTDSTTISGLWNDDLIRRYDLAGPRYTSYPTAPQLSPDFDIKAWQTCLERGNRQSSPLSLYLHIPFCDTVCYYCGCNKVITADRRRTLPYLQALHAEIALQASHVGDEREVRQLHFGGGTPTYLSDGQLAELMQHLRRHFRFSGDGELSIEIHPKTVDVCRLAHLRNLGFNRLSLGVQDFNVDVQNAVNRFNTRTQVRDLVEVARAYRFKSISFDLIYGLPRQTPASFAATLDQVIELRPDRIALFNYAHMPHLFKVQKQISVSELPEPQAKLQMLKDSIDQLTAAGYCYIGMDHFALPHDEMTQAQQAGLLQRNFQGYSTHGDCDLLAFGVSAISSPGNIYVQNHKEINAYQMSLQEGRLPFARGLVLTQDDLIRRDVINQLICHFHLHFETIERKHSLNFADYFAEEMLQLQAMAADGLIRILPDGLIVQPVGRLLIRSLCMVFDAYIHRQTQTLKPQYSRII